MDQAEPKLRHLTSPRGQRLAFRIRGGSTPTLLFLPGYASDMDGAKALAIDGFAASRGLAMLRLDYSGTGSSGGRFEDGTLAIWLEEVLFMIDQLIDGPIIAVGSSMGAWIALHLALRLPEKVVGLVGIAAAPDFTNWGFTTDQKTQLLAHGRLERSSAHDGQPMATTRAFWESGEALRLLDTPIDVACPVRLVHGDADEDVPLPVAMQLKHLLRSADVQLNIIKGGGHRLSKPHEIKAILRTVGALVEPGQ